MLWALLYYILLVESVLRQNFSLYTEIESVLRQNFSLHTEEFVGLDGLF